MAFKVIKASGQPEEFNIQKLVDSLIHSGASEDIAWDIAREVESQIKPSMHTKHIYRIAKKMLRRYSRAADMRYSIKKAIYMLGPAGYQFEKYFAGILRAYGYSAETNRFLKGYCITHEVDIFAVRDDIGGVIECKYHSNGGNPTDIKIALYVYSRFMDIKKAYELNHENRVSIDKGWLVTNTRCTSDAIKYADCVGLKIVSWKYPDENSLERMIENKKLYPVTILSSIKKTSLNLLFKNDIILVRDIADMDEQIFIKQSGLDMASARTLKREADELCRNT
ncbi:MAG TPA: restriction endonuclease [Thermodesulfovibrionales bacterium]|nr:restriction endonuclease [Thermodesulfovibrionales bacterium]